MILGEIVFDNLLISCGLLLKTRVLNWLTYISTDLTVLMLRVLWISFLCADFSSDTVQKSLDIFVEIRIFLHSCLDGGYGVYDCAVVHVAENVANFFIRSCG